MRFPRVEPLTSELCIRACKLHATSSVGVVVITSALHAVGHGFETHTEYFSSTPQATERGVLMKSRTRSWLYGGYARGDRAVENATTEHLLQPDQQSRTSVTNVD